MNFFHKPIFYYIFYLFNIRSIKIHEENERYDEGMKIFVNEIDEKYVKIPYLKEIIKQILHIVFKPINIQLNHKFQFEQLTAVCHCI